jgi:transcriptional regulator with XRE-family HTH domain
MTQSLSWKLRRVAAGIRQQDIALRAGMSTTRYSAIERGERVPSELEASLIDKFLPQLPESEVGQVCGGAR